LSPRPVKNVAVFRCVFGVWVVVVVVVVVVIEAMTLSRMGHSPRPKRLDGRHSPTVRSDARSETFGTGLQTNAVKLSHSGSHAPAWEQVRALRVQRQDRTRSARPAFPRGAWEREAAPSALNLMALGCKPRPAWALIIIPAHQLTAITARSVVRTADPTAPRPWGPLCGPATSRPARPTRRSVERPGSVRAASGRRREAGPRAAPRGLRSADQARKA